MEGLLLKINLCFSALNLMSQFNLENITVYSTKSDEIKTKSVSIIYLNPCSLVSGILKFL